MAAAQSILMLLLWDTVSCKECISQRCSAARQRVWLSVVAAQHVAHVLFTREVKNHLNYEHRVFNSEEFLKTRAAGDQQFYKQVRGVGLGRPHPLSPLC